MVLASSLIAAGALRAASGTWTATSASGSSWSNSANWSGGAVADGTDSTATFPTPGVTGADSVTLNDVGRTIGNITETGTFTAGNYYSFDGSNALTFSTDTGTAPLITLVGASSGTVMRITAPVAGTTGLKITSSGGTGLGRLLWAPSATTLTGGIELSNAVMQVTGTTTSLGSNTVTLSGTTADFQLGGNAGTFSNNFVLTGTTLSFTAYRSSVNNFTLSGVISESVSGRSIQYLNNGLAAGSGTGNTFTVTNSNTYTGNTTIGATTALAISNSNALGMGTSSTVNFAANSTGASLNMSGNITVSGKALTLSGPGTAGAGSLHSTSDTNTWAGSVALGTVASPTIGVDAGTLTVSGQVTGSATNGLNKVGAGTLVLSNGANSYSTGTTISAGTLAVGANAALGTGGVTVGDGTGTDTLQINRGVSAAIGMLTLTNSAHLDFDLTSPKPGTTINVSGNQIGTGTYVVDLLSGSTIDPGTYALLTVSGTNQAAGFTLGSTANSASSDSLNWSNGVLTLTVAAVPEPDSVLIALGTVSVGIWMRFRPRKQARA